MLCCSLLFVDCCFNKFFPKPQLIWLSISAFCTWKSKLLSILSPTSIYIIMHWLIGAFFFQGCPFQNSANCCDGVNGRRLIHKISATAIFIKNASAVFSLKVFSLNRFPLLSFWINGSVSWSAEALIDHLIGIERFFRLYTPQYLLSHKISTQKPNPSLSKPTDAPFSADLFCFDCDGQVAISVK